MVSTRTSIIALTNPELHVKQNVLHAPNRTTHHRQQGSLEAFHFAQVPDADTTWCHCCHVVSVLAEAEAREGSATTCKQEATTA
jgi:hypothetical protein